MVSGSGRVAKRQSGKVWRWWVAALCHGVTLALCPVLLLPGCATTHSGFIEGPIYPSNKRQTRSLDIQVFRNDTEISFTNTTAHVIPAGTMWINAWYSAPIDAVGIGETVTLSLFDFKDQFGETFRAGGFFATERPTKLVLAQIEMENELVGLVVIGEDD